MTVSTTARMAAPAAPVARGQQLDPPPSGAAAPGAAPLSAALRGPALQQRPATGRVPGATPGSRPAAAYLAQPALRAGDLVLVDGEAERINVVDSRGQDVAVVRPLRVDRQRTVPLEALRPLVDGARVRLGADFGDPS